MSGNGCRVPVMLLVVILMSIALPTVVAGQQGPITITSVTATTAGGAAIVTIAANGPLPPPTIGTVDGPPRIFLDFVGVRPRVAAVTKSADPRVARVRVALNSAQPLITRVVIDLVAHAPHRIEQSAGKLVVVVGDAEPLRAVPSLPASTPRSDGNAGSGIPLVPPLPEPSPMAPPPPFPSGSAAPEAELRSATGPPRVPPLPNPTGPARTTKGSRGTSRSSLSPPPPKDLDRYLGTVRGTLDRLRLQQPLLGLIGSSAEMSMDRLQMAGSELQRLSQELAAAEVPASVRAHHDLLLQSARLGVIATAMRMEALGSGDSATLRNANSAASGAVLLFNRACEDLGCQ